MPANPLKPFHLLLCFLRHIIIENIVTVFRYLVAYILIVSKQLVSSCTREKNKFKYSETEIVVDEVHSYGIFRIYIKPVALAVSIVR